MAGLLFVVSREHSDREPNAQRSWRADANHAATAERRWIAAQRANGMGYVVEAARHRPAVGREREVAALAARQLLVGPVPVHDVLPGCPRRRDVLRLALRHARRR